MSNPGNMKPVTFDGWLIALLVMLPATVAWVSGDEAAKFIAPVWIFYWKGILSVLAGGVGALKAFRSMQFAQYKLNGGQDPSHTEVKVQQTEPMKVEMKVTNTNEKTPNPPVATV